MTRYVVLWENHEADPGGGALWEIIGLANASSAAAAIRSIIPGDGYRYVAVPERSWQPLTVETEQKTVTRLAPAQEPAGAATTTEED